MNIEVSIKSNRLIEEREQQQQVIDILNKKNSMREMDLEHEAGTSEMLKKELADKTDEYMQTLSVLEKKQVRRSKFLKCQFSIPNSKKPLCSACENETFDVHECFQQELAVANDRLGKLQRQTSELNEKLKQLPVIKQVCFIFCLKY